MEMRTIGVVGAGTMGTGIAQVAAQAGFEVLLYDVYPQALERAVGQIGKWLERSVEKGRMTPQEREATLGRIRTTTSLADFHPADFVIEAAPEDLGLKKQIFSELDAACRPGVVLATNTSSLAVTEVGALTRRQEQVVGMHFFNPVPLMALVEVIRGHRTDPAAVAATLDLARRMGKTPVEAKDTPGFIVNRVARPFYGEALRIVGEGLADPARVDQCLKAAGFRMGPFELMDLIGIDVNFAVTQSVNRQYFGEPRFRPHVIQEKMVQAGLLGRKTGRGFYDYAAGAPAAAPRGAAEAPGSAAGQLTRTDRHVLVVTGSPAAAAPLVAAAESAGYPVRVLEMEEQALPAGLVEQAAGAWLCLELTPYPRGTKRQLIAALDGALPADALLVAAAQMVSATELAGWTDRPRQVLGLGGLPPYGAAPAVELALPLQAGGEWQPGPELPGALAAAGDFFRRLNLAPLTVGDGAGLVAARTVACLANEAAYALMEGVATPADIDTAMQLGTNYPQGPLAWADRVGLPFILRVLEHLHADLGEDRYRPAPLLRRMAQAGRPLRPDAAGG